MTWRRYVVEGRLGRGGMGVVDLAAGPDGTRVALKRLALHGSADALAGPGPASGARPRCWAGSTTRRIVRLLDVVDDGDDLVLVMPWLPGGSLADRVAAQGPLPPDEVDRARRPPARRRWPPPTGPASCTATSSPPTCCSTTHSRPHLADFGVATARDVTAGLTAGGGGPVGTAGFMAPEQARGEPAGPAADVFSLGATLRWAAHRRRARTATGARDVLLWRAARGKVERCPTHGAAPSSGGASTPCSSPVPSAGPPPRPWPVDPTAPSAAGSPPHGRRRRAPVAAGGRRGVAVAVVAVVADVVALADRRRRPTTPPPRAPPAVQPCGADAPAPTACLLDHADYDGDRRQRLRGGPRRPRRRRARRRSARTSCPPTTSTSSPSRSATTSSSCATASFAFGHHRPGRACRSASRCSTSDGDAARRGHQRRRRAGDAAAPRAGLRRRRRARLTAVVSPVGSDRSRADALRRSGSW